MMSAFALSYHAAYVRNWRVLGAIWVLFALSAAVLQVLVLLEPAWLATSSSSSPSSYPIDPDPSASSASSSSNSDDAHFGLYDWCESGDCHWFPTRLRPLAAAHQAAAALTATATILSLLAVLSILLLVLLRDRYVFLLCSWMHLFAVIAQFGGVLLFPAGWDDERIRKVCHSERYRIGNCTLRWPFWLALILVIDHATLALLGFVLACRQPPSLSASLHSPPLAFVSTRMPSGGDAANTLGALPRARPASMHDSFYSKYSNRMHF